MRKFTIKSVVTALGLSLLSGPVLAADPWSMSALQIIEQVNLRDDGDQQTRKFKLQLTDKSGVMREQDTIGYRKYFGKEKRTIVFYTEPTNVRGTGFLTYDYNETEKDDDRWLYLPALRKVRRIAASDRGAYFLGTDLTYEDVSNDQKVTSSDYNFTLSGKGSVDGIDVLIVEGTPVNDSLARELGYSKVVWHVDPAIWMSRQGEFWDINGAHLKTIKIENVEVIDGIQTAMKIHVENHKTGHQTRFIFTDVSYSAPVDDKVFKKTRLKRGL